MKSTYLHANNPSKPGIALAFLLAIAGSAHAAVTINKSNPQIYTTAALTGFATDGGDMGGMSVSVTFSDSTVQNATWTTSGSSGSASLASWFSLSQSGDTFGNAWTLANLTTGLSIVGFSINARPGNTVFDTSQPNTGTAGSESGLDFQFASGGTDAVVNYSDALKLNSSTNPVGDLYLQMEVALGANSVVAAGRSMSFLQDTDSVRDPGDISVIPEPSASLATALLLGAGLGIRRRRQ
jgi:hypothetical protein